MHFLKKNIKKYEYRKLRKYNIFKLTFSFKDIFYHFKNICLIYFTKAKFLLRMSYS